MKELSIEQKAKAYDEALSRVKDLLEDDPEAPWTIDDISYIFPELKDEIIRKAIIEFFGLQDDNTTYSSITKKDILAWLEKQGEQKAKYHDICDKCVRQPTCQSDCFLQQDEQKSAWSEEDETILKAIILNLEECSKICAIPSKEYVLKCIIWLKSLKKRYTWKPSDEQMEALESATENCAYSEYQDCLRELIAQLKKLREE